MRRMGASPSEKLGPDRFWQMQKVKGKMELTASGNKRRFTRKSSILSGTATTCVVGGVLMRREDYAGKSDDWETYLEEFSGNGMLSIWASAKVRECYHEVEQEDEGRQSIAQDMLGEERRLPEVDHCASRRAGRGHFVVRMPSPVPAGRRGSHLHTERCNAIGGVRRAAASGTGRPRLESRSYRTARTAEKQKCSEHTLRRKEFATT